MYCANDTSNAKAELVVSNDPAGGGRIIRQNRYQSILYYLVIPLQTPDELGTNGGQPEMTGYINRKRRAFPAERVGGKPRAVARRDPILTPNRGQDVVKGHCAR